MQKPVIHLNGTSAVSLCGQYVRACDAIRVAIDAAHDANPNGRDYYPAGDGALKTAQNEQDNRIAWLNTILKEYEELAEHCADHING